jgi:diamine N-acetyltransferase
MASSLIYVPSDESDLPLIRPLWEELNMYHYMKTTFFSDHYRSMTFGERVRELLEKTRYSRMRVDLAKDLNTGRYVGYCVSSVSTGGTGEIDSIYISEQYRNQHVGSDLMERALAWMDEQGAKKKIVMVAAGNEDTFSFYRKFGFFPRMTKLQQVKGYHR